MSTFPAGVRASIPIALTVFLASPASSLVLTVSDVVNEQPADCGTPGGDPCVLAEWLASSIDVSVDATSAEATLVLTNATGGGGGPSFLINELYFSASDVVTSLSLVSSTHSVDGPVTGWTFHASTDPGSPTTGDGFGEHGFALKTKTNRRGSPIASGESVTFVLGYTASAEPTDLDFAQLSAPPANGTQGSTLAAVKFVGGSSPTIDLGRNDSAFGGALEDTGGAVPEPGVAVLLATGLLALAFLGRRRTPGRRSSAD